MTSMKNKIFPDWDSIALITLELATDEIQTVNDMPTYSIPFLLNDFAGNVGMLWGIAFFDLLPKRNGGKR